MERAGGPGAARRLCLVTLPLSTGNGVSDPSCDDFYLFGVRGLTREETLAVPSAMKSRAGDGHNLGGGANPGLPQVCLFAGYENNFDEF